LVAFTAFTLVNASVVFHYAGFIDGAIESGMEAALATAAALRNNN
jgi:monoamine oxidase